MSANGAKKEKTMINIKDYVSVQSDEVFSLRELPWVDCKPPTVNGVKIIAQAGRDLCGEIVTLMVLNYPILNCVAYRKSTETAWTIATRWLGCESNYDLNVDEACRYVDRWIESKVSRNKLENKEPESVKRPDPPKGYRMCSREEAAATNGLVWVSGIGWYGIRGNIHIQAGSFFCTNAPRKFVRCTPDDALDLINLGSYVEAYSTLHHEWQPRKEACVVTNGGRYRVDKYTIPSGFDLAKVMPTIPAPEGLRFTRLESGRGGLVLQRGQEIVGYVPDSAEDRKRCLDSVEQVLSMNAAYDDIHFGETA